MLKNLRIFNKMLFAPTIVLAMLLLVAVVSSLGLRSQRAAMAGIREENLPGFETASTAATEMYGVQAAAYKLLNWYNAEVPESRITANYREQQQTCERVFASLDALAKARGEGTEDGKLAAEAAKVVGEYKKSFGEMMDLAAADINTATMFMSNLETKYESLRVVLGKFAAMEKANTFETIDAAAKNSTRIIFIVLLATAAAFGISIIVTYVLARTVSHSINGVKDAAEGLAEGDLGVVITLESKDETGRLAQSMRKMLKTLHQMIGKLKSGVTDLKGGAKTLATLSTEVAEATNKAAMSSVSVAAATEQTSAMVDSIARAVDHSNANVAAIAAAIEEMSATVGEVARSAANARSMADGAANDADQVAHGVDELSTASSEIGRVTDTITDISEQTKLLALNATIEAARAGEAGKGFAVVAAEIKELARQTNEATAEIGHKVEKIQSSTVQTVSGIRNIVQSIRKMQEAMTNIAAAIEQQSATTREIASNLAETSRGFSEVNANTSQMSGATSGIARDIAQVSAIMETLSRSVHSMEDSAGALNVLAEDMDKMAGWFKV